MSVSAAAGGESALGGDRIPAPRRQSREWPRMGPEEPVPVRGLNKERKQKEGALPQREIQDASGGVPGDHGGRAGKAQRQPPAAVEAQGVRADQGQPVHLRRRPAALPLQGAPLPLHQEAGLRGAHRQVHLLHHRDHRKQGDRLPLLRAELLERSHHHGPHRLPEQEGHPALQGPPGLSRQAPQQHGAAHGEVRVSHPGPTAGSQDQEILLFRT
ncbi:hypothetical protein NDU88_004299 [Pleurodeles waltl]|uniref:Uncharacterized protein n=1 Tax=Pleurodeles waltl TaxID=8319 RepID=A0AAV7TRI6_PLEWA|nr:hypothetical protein NDU88_004299 [Pleurodeles waltl]